MSSAIRQPPQPTAQNAPEHTKAWEPRGDAARRIAYWLFGRLPAPMQGLAVRIAAPKVTLGVCAVIEDAWGQVLLAHHTYRRQAWGLPGGLVRGDEQPTEALARELREELDVTAVVGPLLSAETYTPGRHMTLYYRVTLVGMPVLDGVEVNGLRYATADEAAELMGMPALPWMVRTPARMAS